MMSFEPTHEFNGVKLRKYTKEYPVVYGLEMYFDEQGVDYFLDDRVVKKLASKPKPGEVWIRRDGNDLNGFSPLRYVNIDGNLTFMLDSRTLGLAAYGTSPDLNDIYKKLLNADGTPA